MSLLKPEVSLGVGLATATLVYAIHSQATPSIADIRVAQPGDGNIDASRKAASWTAAAVVSAISLMAKDATVFVVGGSMVIAMDWWTRHANMVNPMTGKASTGPSGMAGADPGDVTVAYAPGAATA